jgi:hypothetical protein
MKMLLQWTWGCYGADVLLAVITIMAAVFDKGDAAGRGLAMVYAAFTVIAIAVLTVIVAIAAYSRTRIGLGIVLALEVTPLVLIAYEFITRLLAKII